MNNENESSNQPIFRSPPVVLATCVVLIMIYAASQFVLDDQGQVALAFWFAFLPTRFLTSDMPGGQIGLVWTLFTHALLHGSWTHVLLNSAWLLVFGTPVARRFGSTGFLITFFVGSAFGALAFTAVNWGVFSILIGASGGVSALTGLAMRFMFQPMLAAKDPFSGRTILIGRRIGDISSILMEKRARTFTMIWMGINLAVPIFALFTGQQGASIAWEAHIGGFVAGLMMADFLKTVGPRDENDVPRQN